MISLAKESQRPVRLRKRTPAVVRQTIRADGRRPRMMMLLRS